VELLSAVVPVVHLILNTWSTPVQYCTTVVVPGTCTNEMVPGHCSPFADSQIQFGSAPLKQTIEYTDCISRKLPLGLIFSDHGFSTVSQKPSMIQILAGLLDLAFNDIFSYIIEHKQLC
jgi:hypothetical protein